MLFIFWILWSYLSRRSLSKQWWLSLLIWTSSTRTRITALPKRESGLLLGKHILYCVSYDSWLLNQLFTIGDWVVPSQYFTLFHTLTSVDRRAPSPWRERYTFQESCWWYPGDARSLPKDQLTSVCPWPTRENHIFVQMETDRMISSFRMTCVKISLSLPSQLWD